ncbi:hypothetical protein [Melittangium boletus]|nr:hypothetical protein [Melittangium boletus]
MVQSLIALNHSREHTHRYCPAHSAFEEAPASQGMASAVRSLEGPAVENPSGASAEASGHEACPYLSFSERKAVLGGGPRALPLLVVRHREDPPAPAPTRALSPLSVLDTAPKASPPARV